MSKEAYVTVYKSISGYTAVLVAWDEELGGYVPTEAHVCSYRDIEHALVDAHEWADKDQMEFRLIIHNSIEGEKYITH